MASDLDRAGAAAAAVGAPAGGRDADHDDRLTRIRPATRWPRFDLRELWHYRELLGIFVWRDVKVRYKETVVGAGWAIFQLALMAFVYVVVFGRFARFPSGNIHYALFIVGGLLPWQYFSSSVTSGAASLVSSVNLVTKVYFPRLLLPLATVFVPVLDFLLGLVVLVAMMAWFDTWPPGAEVLLAPAFLLLGVVLRDRVHAAPVGGERALPGRPVRDPGLPPGRPARLGCSVRRLRPAGEVADDPGVQPDDHGGRRLALGRARLTCHPRPAPSVVGVGVAVAVLVAGLAYFRSSEPRFADTI